MAEGRKTFKLEIVTPDRYFFKGQAESLILPAIDGLYGVEAGHEPVVTAVEAGELRFKTEGQWQLAAVGQGFAEILLVSSAERPEEIDARRAEAAKERAEEYLRQKQSVQEYYRSKAALARAMARLKIKKK